MYNNEKIECSTKNLSDSVFELQNSIAADFLQNKGIICIHKVTRAGATTSLVKCCVDQGKKAVVLVPTIKIIKEIEKKIPQIVRKKPRIIQILSNPEICRKLTKDPNMKFQFKPNCQTCEYHFSTECPLQNILNEDYDVCILTYDKLRALQSSSSVESLKIIAKMAKSEVFILDEFSTAILMDIPTLTIKSVDKNGVTIDLREKLHALHNEIGQISETAELLLWETIDKFLDQCENINQSGVFQNDLNAVFTEKENRIFFSYAWQVLTQLTKYGLETQLLQDILLVAFSKKFVLSKENGTIKVTPKVEDALKYLREFSEKTGFGKTLFIVDSYQPNVNYTSVFKTSVTHSLWGNSGDPLNTNASQLIICDTAHWGSVNFVRDKKLQKQTQLFLESLLQKFSPEKVIVATTNKQMFRLVSGWRLPDQVKITWFRSDLMRGIPVENRRIMVCIGGPYLPKSAYTAESESFNFEDIVTYTESLSAEEKILKIAQVLRVDDTKGEFINAIGRVKDPTGKERSVVFTLGIQINEITALLKQSEQYFVPSPNILKPFSKGGLTRDSLLMAEIWLSAELEQTTLKNIKDLPILARIIRETKDKSKISASAVIPNFKNEIIRAAVRNYPLLQHQGISLLNKQGGYSFVTH